jgi:hypothetical protein
MSSEEERAIDTGDTVKHAPTGETWVVAYVQNGRLAWCGWPEGEADLKDCALVEAATDEYRLRLLNQMAEMRHRDDSRCRYARWRLGIREQ